MRCTPVGTWETRRPKYVPGRGISKAPRRVLSARDDPAEEKAHEESRHHHSYASSYDVSFIFEALHRKRFVDEQGHSIRGRTLTSDEIRIPQTVVYRGGFPAQWYFHSKQDGRIIKKKPQNIVIPQIFEVFGAENGSCNTDVVAIFVGTVGSAEGPRNQVVHFDRKKLKDFLYSENVMKEGFLQRFVAPEAVPFDSAARNATLHAIWSRYDLKVEQRANKMKLDDRRHNFVEKVNIMTTRTNSMTINCNSMLHRKIDEQCKLIAEHIQATSSDKAEVTSITAYFKIGENNRLWLLFASSVTVAPKFQDGFGYIPSLKTFTGRHSPMLTCPDNLMGDEDQHRPQNPKANCSMCDLSSSEDENSCAYAITYKMLSEYVQKKREFFLMQIKGSAVLELDHTHQSTANRRNELEESDLNTKAASVFTVLDTDKDGCIAIVELWSGLMDLGYFPNEISTILGLAAKMRKLHADNPAHYIHATNASDLGDALGSPFGLRQIRKAQVLSPEDVMAREAGKARQTVPAASSGANVGSSAAEQSLGSEKPTGSPLSGDADRREAAGRRDEERPENDSMPRVVEFKDDCRGSRCDIEVLEVKEMFPAVTKVEFARGMGQAVMQMSPERRSRWCANVDMRGEVFHALPKEICGVDGQDPDGQNEGYTQAEVEKKVAEFARKAANRAKMFILQKRLPPFLQHLKTQIPSAHMRRIVMSDTITEDFGSKKIWVCKRCAQVYNSTASGTIGWSEKVVEKLRTKDTNTALDALRVVQMETRLQGWDDYYPLGEVPHTCTPRMYQALHTHAQRSYVVGPPQSTAGGKKNLLGEVSRRRHKTSEEYRKPPGTCGPPLTQADLYQRLSDPDMIKLTQRLGLTPRGPVRSKLDMKTVAKTQRAQTTARTHRDKPHARDSNLPITADGTARWWPKPRLSHERLQHQLSHELNVGTAVH